MARAISRRRAFNQGVRSASSSGIPAYILATLAAEWNESASRNSQPSSCARWAATVVLPAPETPITMTTKPTLPFLRRGHRHCQRLGDQGFGLEIHHGRAILVGAVSMVVFDTDIDGVGGHTFEIFHTVLERGKPPRFTGEGTDFPHFAVLVGHSHVAGGNIHDYAPHVGMHTGFLVWAIVNIHDLYVLIFERQFVVGRFGLDRLLRLTQAQGQERETPHPKGPAEHVSSPEPSRGVYDWRDTTTQYSSSQV